jgi:hypothetical protein
MTLQDTEAARIRHVVSDWADRVARGEKMPRYGFDAQGQDSGKEQENG